MRENHDVDRRVIELQRIEVASECDRVWSAIDDHSARSISDVSRFPLSDIEQPNNQLFRPPESVTKLVNRTQAAGFLPGNADAIRARLPGAL